MREILFRGKTIESNEWVYGLLFINSAGCSFITHLDELQPSYNDQDSGNFVKYDEIAFESIGQYVGIEDEYGKKIFEGDIVKWVDSDWHVRINEVKFTKGHFFICNYNYTLDRYPNITVVGNIHDNQKLLKGK